MADRGTTPRSDLSRPTDAGRPDMNFSLESMRTLDFQDYQICYQDVGHGPVIVLLHGWSLNSTYWAPQIEFLAKNYRVIAYDWRGMGCSGGGPEGYDYQALCDEAKAVISALCGDQKPTLIGHSLGGNIVLSYAIENSEQLSGIAVVDAPLPHRLLEACMLAAFRRVSEKMSLKLMSAFARNGLWGVRYSQVHPDVIAYWEKQFSSNSVTALVNSLAAWAKRPNPIPHLGNIRIKAVLITGAQDTVAGKDMLALHRAWAGSRLHVLENASHMSFVEKPEEFNNIIASFLDRPPAA